MRLTATNARWYRAGTVMLSTVKLPSYSTYKETFESCIFHDKGGSDVIASYQTIQEAMEGHEILRRRYGLK